MSNLPSVDGKKLLKILRKAGFEMVRIKGSHHFIRHTDGRGTVVPVHAKVKYRDRVISQNFERL